MSSSREAEDDHQRGRSVSASTSSPPPTRMAVGTPDRDIYRDGNRDPYRGGDTGTASLREPPLLL